MGRAAISLSVPNAFDSFFCCCWTVVFAVSRQTWGASTMQHAYIKYRFFIKHGLFDESLPWHFHFALRFCWHLRDEDSTIFQLIIAITKRQVMNLVETAKARSFWIRFFDKANCNKAHEFAGDLCRSCSAIAQARRQSDPSRLARSWRDSFWTDQTC